MPCFSSAARWAIKTVQSTVVKVRPTHQHNSKKIDVALLLLAIQGAHNWDCTPPTCLLKPKCLTEFGESKLRLR